MILSSRASLMSVCRIISIDVATSINSGEHDERLSNTTIY